MLVGDGEHNAHFVCNGFKSGNRIFRLDVGISGIRLRRRLPGSLWRSLWRCLRRSLGRRLRRRAMTKPETDWRAVTASEAARPPSALWPRFAQIQNDSPPQAMRPTRQAMQTGNRAIRVSSELTSLYPEQTAGMTNEPERRRVTLVQRPNSWSGGVSAGHFPGSSADFPIPPAAAARTSAIPWCADGRIPARPNAENSVPT